MNLFLCNCCVFLMKLSLTKINKLKIQRANCYKIKIKIKVLQIVVELLKAWQIRYKKVTQEGRKGQRTHHFRSSDNHVLSGR